MEAAVSKRGFFTALGGVAARDRGVPQHVGELVVPVHERRRQQVVLRVEIPVDGAEGDVRSFGDVAHLHGLVSAF